MITLFNLALFSQTPPTERAIAMFCRYCGHEISVDSRFCSECGRSTTSTEGNVGVSIIGNQNAPIITVGDRNVINQGGAPDRGAEYEVSCQKKIPLKKWALALTSLLSAAASLATIAPALKAAILTAFSLIQGKTAANQEDTFPYQHVNYVSLSFFLLWISLATLSIRLFLLVKSRTMLFSRFSSLPAITGWGGQINLVKFKGDCPTCQGKLRFYSKPIEWTISPQSGRRSVTKRALAAECTRNSDHWWTIDPTDSSPEH